MSNTATLKETDVVVIKTLLKHEHILPINTISIDEMVELVANDSDEQKVTIAKPTMYKMVNRLLELGYLKEGLKSGRNRKFYVSPEGAKVCAEYHKVSDSDKEALILSWGKILKPDVSADWKTLFAEQKQRVEKKKDEVQ